VIATPRVNTKTDSPPPEGCRGGSRRTGATHPRRLRPSFPSQEGTFWKTGITKSRRGSDPIQPLCLS
jgi:hypothetical protein